MFSNVEDRAYVLICFARSGPWTCLFKTIGGGGAYIKNYLQYWQKHVNTEHNYKSKTSEFRLSGPKRIM